MIADAPLFHAVLCLLLAADAVVILRWMWRVS